MPMFSMKEQSRQTFMASSPLKVDSPSQSSSFPLQHLLSLRNNIKKKSKKEMKRRFSDEQIKSLEYSFESESRPDSNVKHEIAGKLELQPRQVSIWFQNRRARHKSKQIEREFGSLKADFDRLASSFESLKRENDLLTVQVSR